MERDIDLDSSEYRKKVWENEYRFRKGLPSSNTFNPSLSLKYFLDDYTDINKGLAIDIGCGNARNCLYLHENGFKKVLGFDISESAIEFGKMMIKEKGLEKEISIEARDIKDGFVCEDNTVDLIIDMMTLHSLTKKARDSVISQSIKVMKKGAHYLLFTIEAGSPSSQALIEQCPGPEVNSYRFQVDSDIITEKVFSKKELISMFAPLKMVSYLEITAKTKAYKGQYNRVYCNVLFQKL